MSRLLVDELISELVQEVTPTKNVNMTHIYPNLYKEQLPAGSLKIEVRDSGGGKITESNAVTIASIDSALSSLGFDHGFIRFNLQFNFRKDTVYNLALVSTGYTFASGAFMGWLRDFDHLTDATRRNPVSYSNADGFLSSFEFIVFEKALFRKGVT